MVIIENIIDLILAEQKKKDFGTILFCFFKRDTCLKIVIFRYL